MKLYVGNLSFSTTEETLQAEFGAHGQVEEVAVITDRDTGRPRGFAFVSMNNDNEARAAIEALNGTELDGRTITVNEARPKSNGGGGGGGGRGGGGYRGGGVAAAVAAAVVASAGKVLRPTAYASIDYPVVRKSRLNRTGPLTPSSCQRAL
jgi:RNA recognition motif-containing protein